MTQKVELLKNKLTNETTIKSERKIMKRRGLCENKLKDEMGINR